MRALLLPVVLAVWLGSTLVLAELRPFRRVALAERVRPYVASPAGPVGRAAPTRFGTLAALGHLAEPLAGSLGSLVARAVGIREELAVRLERVHSPYTPSSFRLRQLGCAVAAAAGAVALVAATTPPPVLAMLFLLGAPLLAFLLLEQQIASASARRQRRVRLELPVVSEQLGTLLSAGYSLGSALDRIARRGSGACAEDLRRVCARTRHGLGEIDALREWAELADVDALHRLVGVLALNREAADLGRLIADEAQAIRLDVQRELVEVIERRAQQVWIPVTVATLLPGVMFLAVPFIEAMRLFTSS